MENTDFDSTHFKVLLIGVSKYEDNKFLADIPNIKANVEQLYDVLTKISGIPERNITVSLNQDKRKIEETITKFSKNTDYDDTLFIYYTGHGIISRENFKLYLATPQTTEELLEASSIKISHFKELLSFSRARRKVVILDACHSGQIITEEGTLGSDYETKIITELSDIEGTYIMTSSSEHDSSHYPVDNKVAPTYFTAEIINILRSGVQRNTPYITLRDIYDNIKLEFKKRKLPAPVQMNVINADRIPIAPNSLFDPNKPVEKLDFQPIEIQNRKTNIFSVIVGVLLILASITTSVVVYRTRYINIETDKPMANTHIVINKNMWVDSLTNRAKKYEEKVSDYPYAILLYEQAYKISNDTNLLYKIKELNAGIDAEVSRYKSMINSYINADNIDNSKVLILEKVNKGLELRPNDKFLRHIKDSIIKNNFFNER